MKAMILALALTASVPAFAVVPEAQTILQRDRLLLLGSAQDWGDFLAKTQPAVQQKFGPELSCIKAGAQAADSIEALRPLQLRLEAWRQALRFELFPFLPQADQTSPEVFLAQAQVQAFQAVAKLRQTALAKDQQAKLDDLTARIRVASDARSLDPLFDNVGFARPDPIAAVVFNGAFSGWSSPAPAAYRSLKINDVPSPLELGAADRERFAKVSELLRSRGASQKVIDLTIAEAIRQNVDPLLVLALVQNESGFQAGATSSVGARGLMQIMPDTGRGLGVSNPDNLYHAETNLQAGVRFLKGLWGKFVDFSFSALSRVDPLSDSGVKKAIAAYNAGPGAVQKYGGVPPYRETRAYVAKVLNTYLELRRRFAGA